MVDEILTVVIPVVSIVMAAVAVLIICGLISEAIRMIKKRLSERGN